MTALLLAIFKEIKYMKKLLILPFVMNIYVVAFSKESKQNCISEKGNSSGRSNYYNNDEWAFRVEAIIEREEGIKDAYSKFPQLSSLNVTGVYLNDVNDFWQRFYAYITENKSLFTRHYTILKLKSLHHFKLEEIE
jgi:hypothetical protein